MFTFCIFRALLSTFIRYLRAVAICLCTLPLLTRSFLINEVISAIKKLKTGKSYGADNILNEYLIETVDILGSHLCDLFNSILESGVFPESWTEGIVIPIFKKGDKMDCGNYRGITLLSCFSKLFSHLESEINVLLRS